MQQCRLSSWHKREQGPSTRRLAQLLSACPEDPFLTKRSKRRSRNKGNNAVILEKKRTISRYWCELICPPLIWLLFCWFCAQYFLKERHFKCPLLFLQHSRLVPSILFNVMPISPGESSYLWPYLLCWPFLMGVLCVFVGKVLKLLWKSNAGKKKKRVWQLVSLCMQMCVTEVM